MDTNTEKKERTIPWKKLLLLTGLAFLLIIFLLLAIVWYLIASAPDIDTITVSPRESATYILDENGKELRKLTLAASNRDIVSLDQIPADLQHAIVAIEDERFYEHGGIDLRGITRAFLTGITSGRFSEGASTITQQLIKNSVFTDWTLENSFADRLSRKIQEQYLALQLEERMEKDEILTHYLNTINLGAGCYGVQAASRRYFGKNVSELTLPEAAVLAAIPQNPSGYNPITHPNANQKRAQTVLQYMKNQGYITDAQYQAALADPVYTRIREYDDTYEEATIYTYYEDALIAQAMQLLKEELHLSSEQAYRAVYSGGLRIISAQDPSLQQICEEEFSNPANFPADTQFGIDYALSIADASGLVTHYGSDALRSYLHENGQPQFDLMCSSKEEAEQDAAAFRSHILETEKDSQLLAERLTLSPQPQASLVLIDQHTGFVRAIVGGRGEKTASLTLNRATDTTRQPGSTFKILTAYAPALDAFGQTLITEYENTPYRYEDGTSVSNWDLNDYSGTVTIREAIVRSVNVAAVRCITAISPQTGFDYAQRFGISTLHETFESNGAFSTDIIQPLALGGITQGVTNLELCSAYSTIANCGFASRPLFFSKILDRNGNILLDYSEPQFTSVIKESTAFLLTSAMEDVIADPSGTAYGTVYAGGHPAAGKTGTTSNYKDIWFAGYTPWYTCSVWGGYDNNTVLPEGARSYSKTLWSAVMSRIHHTLPVKEFTQPDSVCAVTLCRESHLRAVTDACSDTYTEYFEKGSEPQKECSLHEPLPQTEPIFIFPDLLDELLTEPSSESESETGSESVSESSPESALETESESVSESESESESDSETTTETESESISSLDDLLQRLQLP